jgi:large subunit ribosomal protein L19
MNEPCGKVRGLNSAIFIYMNTLQSGISVSPVNMNDRKELGLKAGDTVRVHQKIQDKGKTRIQIFEGVVLARKHGAEAGATFTVRKVASGVGVEKIYPLYSPNIDKIEIVKRAKVRRAKLYYIREKVAREIKRQMRRMNLVSMSTESEIEEAARAEAEAKAAAEAEAKIAEELAQKEAAAAAKAAEEAAAQEAAAAPAPEEAPAEAPAVEDAPSEEKKD